MYKPIGNESMKLFTAVLENGFAISCIIVFLSTLSSQSEFSKFGLIRSIIFSTAFAVSLSWNKKFEFGLMKFLPAVRQFNRLAFVLIY